MIDTKKWEELHGKRTELEAQWAVCRKITKLVDVESRNSFNNRNYYEMQAWNDVLKSVNAKLEILNDEYEKLIEQMEAMQG